MARRSATRPPVRELQLATLVDTPPDGPGWLHEQKFDGYRILAELDRGAVRLSFQGLRHDKPARDVVREAPVHMDR
jgi:ATP-dependent DNA ligase